MTSEALHSAYLEAVGHDLQVAARRQAQALRRRAHLRVAALSATLLVLLAGSAVAGSSILGAHATGLVQSTIDSLWKGGDRTTLAPAMGDARAVARTDDVILYRSPSNDPGSVCLAVIASDLRFAQGDRGQSCVARAGKGALPLGVFSYGIRGHQAIFGQIRLPAGGKLVLERPNGDRVRIVLGVDGYFLGQVPIARRAPGAIPVVATLRLLARDGSVVATRAIPGLAD